MQVIVEEAIMLVTLTSTQFTQVSLVRRARLNKVHTSRRLASASKEALCLIKVIPQLICMPKSISQLVIITLHMCEISPLVPRVEQSQGASHVVNHVVSQEVNQELTNRENES